MSDWVEAMTLDELQAKGQAVCKSGGKQIAVFLGEGGAVHACNNRCPHEGYPLVEGTLNEGCMLTCNWHNWKFDLSTGEAVIGGDAVRLYETRIEDGRILVDIEDAPLEERQQKILEGLGEAIDDHDYGRIGREIARLIKAGGDPLAVVRAAIWQTHDRFEFGMTHAMAAAPDWLWLRDNLGENAAHKLVPLMEIVGHLSRNALREEPYPYAGVSTPFDRDALIAAIENEDEEKAVAYVRGGLEAGLEYPDMEKALAEAALAHYQDFGHAIIYVFKAGQLIDALGDKVLEPVLLALTRMLINCSREDLIPEFKDYAPALAAWPNGGGEAAVAPEDFDALGVKAALQRTLDSSGRGEELFDALMGAVARQMLHFDAQLMYRTDNTVSRNITWLGFTHALTGFNAARVMCERYESLWPAALLQTACFLGRNAPFVDFEQDMTEWRVDDPEAFLNESLKDLFDHAQPEYIVSAHLVKTLMAARREMADAPDAPWTGDLAAALNRFLNTPLKRKHALRTAHQSLGFVEKED